MAKELTKPKATEEVDEVIDTVTNAVPKVTYQNTDNYKKEINIGGLTYLATANGTIEFPLQYEPNFLGNVVGNWSKVTN